MNFLHKYQKKQRIILSAAMDLFLSNGYQNTSMDKISATAKVTKQTVYRYFPSKLDLFREVIEFMAPEGREYIFGHEDVGKELETFAREFVNAHLTKERLGLFRLIVSEGSRTTEIGEIFTKMAPSSRKKQLVTYISEHFTTSFPEKDADIFSAMLLHPRKDILAGILEIPDSTWIDQHCSYVTKLFLQGRRLRV